jgi:hypothetical protein
MPSARILHCACTRAPFDAEEARAAARKGIVAWFDPAAGAFLLKSKFARTLPAA